MRELSLVFLTLILCSCGKFQEQTNSAVLPPAVTAARCIPGTPSTTPVLTVAQWAQGAQLFDDLGVFHRKITTSSDEAQKYFDQGMRLLWAFNHDESTRSFAKAALLDPHCAACYWGVALTVGPNYNVPVMAETRAKVAWEALQQAQKYAPQSSPIEQALITALGKRYQGPKALDPSNEGPVLTAYADDMREVAKKFSDDLDVQVLFAESLMTTNAWKLWTLDGKPASGTLEVVATLESALKRDPQHPGANHYYIHTMEASLHPEKALASAARLHDLVPGAGHLVHMPAHIFQRVGHYADASEANRMGVDADKTYLSKTRPPDYYAMYVGHNYQFLAYSAAMEGRKAETLDATKHSREVLPDEMLLAMPGADWTLTETYTGMDRFGLWDQILAEQAPNAKLLGLTGGYLFERASALAAKGKIDEAKAELSRFEKLAADTPADYGAGLNTAKDVFAVAALVVKARIAQAEKKSSDAITWFKEAVAKEDQLAYAEPADWFFPVRHLLGAELLKAKQAKEAEAVYREDLRRHPDNGWGLFGLVQALKAQKKDAAAAKVEQQFKAAWKSADVTLSASAF